MRTISSIDAHLMCCAVLTLRQSRPDGDAAGRPGSGRGGRRLRRSQARRTPRCGSRCRRSSRPAPANSAPPSDAIVLFDGKNLDQWVSTKDKSPAGWTVADGVVTVKRRPGNIETKRSFKNYQLHLEWRIPPDITGTDQARGNSGLFLASNGRRRCRLRAADPRFVQQQDLRQRPGGQHLQAGHPARQCDAQAGRVAGLRRRSGRRRRSTPTARVKTPGLRHRVPQRRARAEPLRAEGRDALHRQAGIQEVRHGADQAAGARRSEPADQLPEHLDPGNQVGMLNAEC